MPQGFQHANVEEKASTIHRIRLFAGSAIRAALA
jgi:hypothetical protein